MGKHIGLDELRFADWIRPDDGVAWGQGAAEPLALTRALLDQRHAVGGFDAFVGLCSNGTVLPEHGDCVRFRSYCGTAGNRALADAGVLDIVPAHYSHLPRLIRAGLLKVDVLLLQVSAADADGRHSFGIAQEYLAAALDSARVVIAEVNDQVPWTPTDRPLTADDFDFMVHTSRRPAAIEPRPPSAVEECIATRVADLIEDGSVIQCGVGSLPETILERLRGRRDLAIHSGVIGDAVVDLVEAGAVTNARKHVDTGITVTGNLMGSERLYRFVERNPAVRLCGTDHTHDGALLAAFERLVAINAAIEVDITGQINAEVAAGSYVGSVGGAADYLRAATLSRGGLPIVALPSRTAKASRIVSRLGGPVSTARSDAAIIVTEHGMADLRGCSLRQRIERMLAIADPEFRDALADSVADMAGAARVRVK